MANIPNCFKGSSTKKGFNQDPVPQKARSLQSALAFKNGGAKFSKDTPNFSGATKFAPLNFESNSKPPKKPSGMDVRLGANSTFLLICQSRKSKGPKQTSIYMTDAFNGVIHFMAKNAFLMDAGSRGFF